MQLFAPHFIATRLWSRVHLLLVKFFITHELNTIWRWNLHQSNSLTKMQKTAEARGCKPWVTNLLIIPCTLGILTTTITYYMIFLEYVNESQVNARAVQQSKGPSTNIDPVGHLLLVSGDVEGDRMTPKAGSVRRHVTGIGMVLLPANTQTHRQTNAHTNKQTNKLVHVSK